MRLKSFRAPTVAEAMKLVRDHFGDHAVIVSTQRSETDGVRVTAAIDQVDTEERASHISPTYDSGDVIEIISAALEFHGVPSALADRLLGISSNLLLDDAAAAMAVALDAAFSFQPFENKTDPLRAMLVGPPGAGKTVTLAKLAVRATFAKQNLTVISTDTVRAGGIDQLAAFTRLLKLPLLTAETPEELQEVMHQQSPDTHILIDAVASNNLVDSEMRDLQNFVQAAGVSPVLVLSTGLDCDEAKDIALTFREIGCQEMILTRTDANKRFGSALVAAHEAKLKFTEMTNTPHVTHGLTPMSPMSLARLMLPDTQSNRQIPVPGSRPAKPQSAPPHMPPQAQIPQPQQGKSPQPVHKPLVIRAREASSDQAAALPERATPAQQS